MLLTCYQGRSVYRKTKTSDTVWNKWQQLTERAFSNTFFSLSAVIRAVRCVALQCKYYTIEKFTAWRVNSTLNFTRKTDIARFVKRWVWYRFFKHNGITVKWCLSLKFSSENDKNKQSSHLNTANLSPRFLFLFEIVICVMGFSC